MFTANFLFLLHTLSLTTFVIGLCFSGSFTGSNPSGMLTWERSQYNKLQTEFLKGLNHFFLSKREVTLGELALQIANLTETWQSYQRGRKAQTKAKTGVCCNELSSQAKACWKSNFLTHSIKTCTIHVFKLLLKKKKKKKRHNRLCVLQSAKEGKFQLEIKLFLFF